MDINSSEPSSSLAAPKSVNLYTKLKQNRFYFYNSQNSTLKDEFRISSDDHNATGTGRTLITGTDFENGIRENPNPLDRIC